MKEKGVTVFVYNFPHRKSQDFLFRLWVSGVPIDHVLAANPVQLNIPNNSIRTKVRHTGFIHPKEVAERAGACFHVVPHRGQEIVKLLRQIRPDLGLIGGARILENDVIEQFSSGVINFHPGLIPEARGLDAMLWSIYEDVPLGVTSHMIDGRVDAGRVVERREIQIHTDDTLMDLSERLYEVQLEMLLPAIDRVRKSKFLGIDPEERKCNRKMPEAIERRVVSLVGDYVIRHAQDDLSAN